MFRIRSAVGGALVLGGMRLALAQSAPEVVWQEPTPGLLANSVMAVAWSPGADQIAVGSNDRWFRARQASSGALQYSVLEPKNSGGPGTILYSHDGALIGVRNQSSGLAFRVQRASDGVFLGNVVGTVGANGIVHFAPDATLVASTGGDGTLSDWNFGDLTAFQVTGSGYQTVTTTFDFSPDGSLQTAAKKSTVIVQRTSDGAVVARLRNASKVEFSPDGHLLATWSASPVNQVVLWNTSDWSVVKQLPATSSLESVSALRFSPDVQRLAVSGYSPFLNQGLWDQKGFIRIWDIAKGTVVADYEQGLDIAVTSPVAWSPDGARFGYGLYDGTVAVAIAP